ncbi:MAG: hypothetical protein HKP55_01290 [Gammaproteobacteria bacterium]|nr:hypothetical protein [Gammaproteobacteria bacterium]
MKKYGLFLVLLVLSTVASARQVIELIPLQSQLPQDIIPVIRPLLGADSAINSMHNQLILKVEESQLEEIRQLIRQLDRPPQRLLIEVSLEGSGQGRQSGYGVKGRINTEGNSRANVRIKEYRTRDRYDSSQTIQATEGYPARINYGRIIPYQEYDIEVRGNRLSQRQYTSFRDATSGFYVIPRLNGNQVSLEIQQHRNRYRPDGSMAVQDASTFVRGQLGEWIRLGGVGQTTHRHRQGIVHRSTRNSNDDQQIYVRVTRN